MSTFDKAFALVIAHEGGYSDHPEDRGGKTMYGISQRAYPNLDIASLTLDGAKAIYKRDYWDKVRGDELREDVATQLFDSAVNHGVGAAIRMLQRTLRVKADGVLGPETMAAPLSGVLEFRSRFNAQRLRLYASLSDVQVSTFGKGWMRRVADNLDSA